MEAFATYTHAFDHVGVLGNLCGPLASKDRASQGHFFQVTFAAAICKGYEKVFTYIRADNFGALATYKSQGFQTIGTARRHAKINGHYVDEIMVEKLLSQISI